LNSSTNSPPIWWHQFAAASGPGFGITNPKIQHSMQIGCFIHTVLEQLVVSSSAYYLEDECGGDADDEEEGGHDEVRHRNPEPRRVVDARPRPAGVVH